MSIIRLLRTFGKYTVEIERKGTVQDLLDIAFLGKDTVNMDRRLFHRHHSFLLQISYESLNGKHSGRTIGYFKFTGVSEEI